MFCRNADRRDSRRRNRSSLRSKYDHLIKEALLKARPGLDVKRADEVAAPGVINSDIITRIMHSDLVLADITFANPNVYYELGLRHAARPGTVLVKDRNAPPPPFDVHGLRHISYSNTTDGLHALAKELKKQIDWLEQNQGKPDNAFLEFAQVTRFRYPDFGGITEEAIERQASLLLRLVKNPEIAKVFQDAQATGGQFSIEQLSKLAHEDESVVLDLVKHLVQTGGANILTPRKKE